MNNITHTPAIIIPGMFQSMLYSTSSEETAASAWPPNLDGDKVMKEIKSSLLKMIMFRRDMGFSDKIANFVSEICESLAYKPDGLPKYPIQCMSYKNSYAECSEKEQSFIKKMFPVKDLVDIIGGENVWYFAYNFLSAPFENAKKLREYIDLIREKTGSDKVSFITLSLGAPVLNAYLSEYGEKGDTARVVYFFSAVQGTPVVADIIGNTINTDGVLSVADILGGTNTSEFATMAKMMPNGVLESAVMKSLGVMRDKILINSPFVWSLVPPSDYPTLSTRLIGNSEHEQLRVQTDRYFEALSVLPSKLFKLKENGTEFFFEAGYGRHLLALCRNDAVSSDTIVDISSATIGALAENPEKKPERRCVNSTHSHAAPDGTVDASFSLFPENTWLFFEQKHAAATHNEDALEVAVRALTDSDFKNIYSVEELPQFGFSSDNRE